MKLARRILLGLALVLATLGIQDSATTGQEPEELHVGTLRIGKVLFLGNSITLHGPAPEIGWTGNWGMAASAQEKDYVHLLLDRIAKAAGGKPQVMIKNVADFERRLNDYNLRDELKQELAFEADVIIIALGENAAPVKTPEAQGAVPQSVREPPRRVEAARPTNNPRPQPVLARRRQGRADEAILRRGGRRLCR